MFGHTACKLAIPGQAARPPKLAQLLAERLIGGAPPGWASWPT